MARILRLSEPRRYISRSSGAKILSDPHLTDCTGLLVLEEVHGLGSAGFMTLETPGPAADAERVRALIRGYRDGEDPDLSRLAGALFEMLYARIPSLTASTDKNEQHRILETYLVELGLPSSPDLQYIAGPVLWYAREKRVVPPAKGEGVEAKSWTLDQRVFEEAGATLDEGRIAFGDWMTNALQALLSEQQ